MMKKNTILKILSFVLVLTMVVAAVLLTGCGNKKEDPKASQAELDAAKAALEAAQAEIEKIQANIDKMTKDGSATADDLKKAQEELEAAQKALEELTQDTTAVVSEDVYEALYGKDSDKSIAKYEKKVKELADAKTSRYYIVDYDGDDATKMSEAWYVDMTAPELPGKIRTMVTVAAPTVVEEPAVVKEPAVVEEVAPVEEPAVVTNPEEYEGSYPAELDNTTYETEDDHQQAYQGYETAVTAYQAYQAYQAYLTAKDAYDAYVAAKDAYDAYVAAQAAYDAYAAAKTDYIAIFADDAEEALTIEKIADTAKALYDAAKAAYDKGLVEKNDWLIFSANYTKYQADIAQYLIDEETYNAYVLAQTTLADAKNYAAYRASEVYSVYKTCMSWVNSRLKLATNAGVIDQAWADMEAAFAGIKKIVDKYDDELASLMPDANGGKLTVIQYDKYGDPIDQLADLKAYHEWIRTQPKLKFNDATTDGSEAPSEKNYKALLDAYDKIWEVDYANNAALELAEDYGVADTSAIKITFTKNTDGTYTQDDKKANEALGKFYTTFVVYYEVTEKDDVTGKEVTNIYWVDNYNNIVKNNKGEFEFTGKYVFDGKELTPVKNNEGKPTGKFTVNGKNVVVKAFKFADIFNKDANTDAQYYVATDITKDLSGYAMYFARDARYTELLAAKTEFASLYTQMTTLKNYKTTLPVYSDCAVLEGDLKKLADFQEKYKLAQVDWYTDDEIAKMELSGDALKAFKAQNDENKLMNALNADICKQIFDQIDNGANAYGTNGSARIYNISELVKALKALKEELVDPVVEGANKSMTTLLAEWSSANEDTVKYADYDIYEDVDERLNGYWGKDENGDPLWINGVVSHIYNSKGNSKYTVFAQYGTTNAKENAIRDLLDLSTSGYGNVKNLLARATTLDTINTNVKTLAEAFRDNNTKLVTAKVDVTGKETTVKVLDERTGQSEKRYWVITFKTSNNIEKFANDVDDQFPDGWFTDGVIKAEHKDNYDLILEETKAAEFLEQATKTFDTLKKPFDDAYKAVKDVIYSIDVDDDGNETLATEDGKYLQSLANILWARDTIKKLESADDYKGNDFTNFAPGGAGQFKVDTIETTANDLTTTTTITYGKFRTDLNAAVATATSKASTANASATTYINTPLTVETEIVKDVAEPKLSAYASLNQYADAKTVVEKFREWCVTYLGAKQTHEEDQIGDDGEPNGFTDDVRYTDAEFFANVAEYFKPATADGKATGILNVTNNYITYTFVSAENFATLQTITAAKDTMYENARATFLSMLSAKNDLLPTYATKDDINSACAAFVNYVKAYYMQNGESLEAVNAYYNVVSASAFKTNAGKTEVQKKLSAETWDKKAARYASYIINPTDYCLNPEEEDEAKQNWVNDEALYDELKDFIDYYYLVEKLARDEEGKLTGGYADDAKTVAEFFHDYGRYEYIVTADNNRKDKAN